MREAIQFTFDGISSEDMGVHIASPNGGLYEETFLPNRRIIETTVAKKDKPYFQRVEHEPLSFSLSFFIHEWRNRDNLRQIARWLFKDYYKPLYFETNPDRIFYAIVEGSSSLMHNGCKDGYITLNVRCNSAYTYSNVFEADYESLVLNPSNSLAIYNEGDMTIKPKVWITKTVSNGSISIENEANDQIIVMNNLQLNEQVYIDFENEEIVSSLESLTVYRYKDHNNIWLELIEGDNSLTFIGDFDIQIEYELVYLAD